MDFDSGKIYSGNQTLKDFGLPPGKTPLFIGGSGVTLEEIDSKVRICVYPVAQTASAKLTLPESGQVITVHVHGLAGGTVWSAIQVKSSAGKIVPSRTEGHGFSFIPVAGQTYNVEAVR